MISTEPGCSLFVFDIVGAPTLTFSNFQIANQDERRAFRGRARRALWSDLQQLNTKMVSKISIMGQLSQLQTQQWRY